MSTLTLAADVAALIGMPLPLLGLINRVKSLWSGRKGPPVWQPAYDIVRLFRKECVYSTTTTPGFRIAPAIFLGTALASASVTPLLGCEPIAAFPFDFVWFAYSWALGRVAIILAAFDTGGSLPVMGAAREATFSSLLEPALFLIAGALCLASGAHSLHGALMPHGEATGVTLFVKGGAVVGLLVILQAECARMPIDDPGTHLELTMVHEVMALDHSGPDLGAIQLGVAIKFFVGCSIIATLLNPWAGSGGPLAAVANLVLCGLIAVLVGTTESLVARLQLRAVPQYLAVALVSGAVALLATAWNSGAGP
jgi:formate hydrogenlyase subunit 4